jgi:hypothetical protein
VKGDAKVPKHEFRVTIDAELPPETVKRIANAVQKSVLGELAGTDLKVPLAIDFLGNGHGTQGIAIAARGLSK